jgi:hypothetical protein
MICRHRGQLSTTCTAITAGHLKKWRRELREMPALFDCAEDVLYLPKLDERNCDSRRAGAASSSGLSGSVMQQKRQA